ncbi:hypothetical protein D6C77_10233 [Aureobasidium pullulans]|nr:hypothetical protein D6C77_10233 [Aureobasidium pullulans]
MAGKKNNKATGKPKALTMSSSSPDSDVVYINTAVTGGLICHQGFQDAHNLDTGVIYIDTTITGTFTGHQVF